MELLQKLQRRGNAPLWPTEYTNRDTRRLYLPHHEAEALAVRNDTPRYVLLKGGEGGGKSVAGIVKTLNRLKRGMSGIMVSPDLPHFKRSLWPEFRRWCPWDFVVSKHRYRGNFVWEPREPFALAFENGTTLFCGGIDDPIAWEGPNVNFAFFDEARRKREADALKVLDGRARIPGPKGEPPQLWITTTPRKHWLYLYFGPLRCRCASCGRDYEHYAPTLGGECYLNMHPSVPPTCPGCSSLRFTAPGDAYAPFKMDAVVVTVLTEDNELNLEEGFSTKRARTLTSAEQRVYLEAEWEDVEDTQRFLEDMALWDRLEEHLPPLGPYEPLVLAADAGVSHASFGLVGLTRHPDPSRHDDCVAVRLVYAWEPPVGGKVDFLGTEDAPGPEMVIRRLCEEYAVAQLAYDPWQLHDMQQRLTRERVVWCKEMPQGATRLEADSQLLDLVMARRLAHSGHDRLRRHVDNADRKRYLGTGRNKLRIVPREEALLVDLAVCTSMAAYECLRLQL